MLSSTVAGTWSAQRRPGELGAADSAIAVIVATGCLEATYFH